MRKERPYRTARTVRTTSAGVAEVPGDGYATSPPNSAHGWSAAASHTTSIPSSRLALNRVAVLMPCPPLHDQSRQPSRAASLLRDPQDRHLEAEGPALREANPKGHIDEFLGAEHVIGKPILPGHGQPGAGAPWAAIRILQEVAIG